MTIQAGLAMDLVRFVVTTVAFAVIMYFIADFMITALTCNSGRNGNYDLVLPTATRWSKPADEQVTTIIEL